LTIRTTVIFSRMRSVELFSDRSYSRTPEGFINDSLPWSLFSG